MSKNNVHELPSAALAAAKAQASRKCWVCQTYTALPGLKYCRTHNNGYYKWLVCSEPGCAKVSERRYAGQDRFTCPDHQGDHGGSGAVVERLERRRPRHAASLRPSPLDRPPLKGNTNVR